MGCRGCLSLLSAIRQPLKRPKQKATIASLRFLCGVGPTAGSHCRCGPRGEIHTESHHLGTGRVCVCHGRQAGEGSGDARRDRGTGAAALHLRVQRGMRIRSLATRRAPSPGSSKPISPVRIECPSSGGSPTRRLRGDPRFATSSAASASRRRLPFVEKLGSGADLFEVTISYLSGKRRLPCKIRIVAEVALCLPEIRQGPIHNWGRMTGYPETIRLPD